MKRVKEKLMIQGFNQFGGKHCQTAALKNILGYHGLHLSEEMLLGLGGGIGFIYWYMKLMPSPFIGTRYGKVDEFLLNICRRIGTEGSIFQTTSITKGYEKLKKLLREDEPAYVFVDMAYLPYMALPETAHFGGHTVVIFGLDEEEDKVYISDRGENAVTASIEDLKKARGSKFPPFPTKNKMLEIKYPSKIRNLEGGIREGIRECCTNMLKPPIKNIGLKGMKKWAGIVPKWPRQFNRLNLFGCLFNTFIYIEIGGTGGSAFRPMYAKFLEEASSIINKPALNDVARLLRESGKVWSGIATAALPDSWPTLKRIRELSIEKNRIFEEQKPRALDKIKKINVQLDGLMKKAEEDLQEKDLTLLLADLQEKISECYEIEKKAFERLNEIVE
ncbi:MAG: BtrH N-terminal domain-containing protein [Candidatus Hydrothermarchaeota archaeon]